MTIRLTRITNTRNAHSPALARALSDALGTGREVSATNWSRSRPMISSSSKRSCRWSSASGMTRPWESFVGGSWALISADHLGRPKEGIDAVGGSAEPDERDDRDPDRVGRALVHPLAHQVPVVGEHHHEDEAYRK